ncbi:hypothetical protein L596_012022 [Steinernema carpocapsae]|uniref:Uncharacterized protein n=2 Tax=Steinernema carpocapsae TaxID=34508 RepID=A0A4V6A4N4_STECR|nr:hypothetical protein L596_012022 [Steinernema carpocapsae]
MEILALRIPPKTHLMLHNFYRYSSNAAQHGARSHKNRSDGEKHVNANGTAAVTANGAATVTANGAATVTANGAATVTANGAATVTANGAATVTANGAATVNFFLEFFNLLTQSRV